MQLLLLLNCKYVCVILWTYNIIILFDAAWYLQYYLHAKLYFAYEISLDYNAMLIKIHEKPLKILKTLIY